MSEILIKLKPTLLGPMMFIPDDAYVGRSLDVLGEFSPGEHELFKITARGGAAVDVGANLGAHSLFFVKHYSHVYCFEPQQVLCRLLAGNLALYPNKTIYNAAVGKEEGVVHFPALDYTVPNNFGGLGRDIVRDKTVDTIKVQLRTLDMVMELRKEEQIDIIKVDVEGMENEVLEGAMGLIEKHKPILYVENDRPEKQKALVQLIYNLGYTASWHLTPLYRPGNFNGVKENIFGGEFVSFNLICVHKDNAWLKIKGAVECTPENYAAPAGCVL